MCFVARAWHHRRQILFVHSACIGLVLLLAGTSVGYGQQLGKRRGVDADSEIPNAMETVGSTSVPIIDGKPLHPSTVDTSARHTSKPATKKGGAKPSFFGRIGASTKRFFTATGEMFSIRRTETKSRMLHNTGWQQPAKPEPKKSWFGSLFEEAKPEPATPQEWLSQPRPKMF